MGREEDREGWRWKEGKGWFPYLRNSNFVGFLPVLLCLFLLLPPPFTSLVSLIFTQPHAKRDCRA